MRILISIIFTMSLLINLAYTQDNKIKKQTVEKVYLVDDFETCLNWEVYNGEHSLPKWKNNNPFLAIIPGAPKALKGSSPKYELLKTRYYYVKGNENKNCLGVKIKMNRFGDTRKFIIPIHKITFPGICKQLSFYVNSRNYKLRIRVMVKDYIGYIHTLEPTPLMLDFYGWKKLIITNIDKKVSQLDENDIYYKPLEFLAFVIDNPYKKAFPKPVYLYIDEFTAVCDIHPLPDYDGKNMINKW